MFPSIKSSLPKNQITLKRLTFKTGMFQSTLTVNLNPILGLRHCKGLDPVFTQNIRVVGNAEGNALRSTLNDIDWIFTFLPGKQTRNYICNQ